MHFPEKVCEVATTWSWEESETIPETTRAITYLNSENLMSPPPAPKRVGGGGIQLKTFKFFHFNAFPYSPHRNCGGGVISEIWIFYQAFQFIMTPPIYDFWKIFFQDTENYPNSFKFLQFLAKFWPFSPIFPPPPIYYNPPNFRFWQKFPTPPAYYTPPYNYGGESKHFRHFLREVGNWLIPVFKTDTCYMNRKMTDTWSSILTNFLIYFPVTMRVGFHFCCASLYDNRKSVFYCKKFQKECNL